MLFELKKQKREIPKINLKKQRMENTTFDSSDPFDYPIEKLPDIIGKYQRGLLLGQTYAGFIYSAMNNESKKIVSLIQVYPPFVTMKWEEVIEYQKKLNQGNILSIEEVIREENQCILVVEYCGLGQISDYIYSSTRFNEETVQIVVIQLVNLLQYLSLNSISFGHLRCANIFINLEGKVKCFGIFPKGFEKAAGPSFAPPEIFKGNSEITESWDVWGLGVIIIEMMNGTAPFAEMAELLKLFQEVNAKIPLPKKSSESLKNLLAMCLKKEAKKRCKISEIFIHEWIKDNLCESEALDKTVLVEFLEEQVVYENYDIKSEKITNFVEECPTLRPMNEETYQEISELTNLKTTRTLLDKVKSEIEENKDMIEETKEKCLDFIKGMEKEIERTEMEYKTVAKAKDEVYRESVMCLAKKGNGIIHPESEELQNKIKEQMVTNQHLENQLLKIQDTFCKSKGGVESLAITLYGKLTSQTINGQKSGNLACSLDKKEKTKNFKTVYVILKDNFFFLYKSANESSPIQVLLISKPASIVAEEKYGKANAFLVEGYVFVANDLKQRDEWINAIKDLKRWFETSINEK
ncbi:serine/threonine protein kinase ark1, putative [Entamoeba histolytica HM-1:IMSS-A]|uniref:non-specific serine/threonine protein kinase n=1 Tax=Entamoeba histolytica HM-1:IMSS-A TaxID=885318 RepID=N9T9R4_ENTH1|nr:serine/threonine protein kinase ark1, putative [Entamoeba histolytica HM-1:IMSS-A]